MLLSLVCAGALLGAGNPALAATPTAAGDACPPEGWSLGSLERLASEGFAVGDPARRDRLAVGLTACLGDPDPALRDGIAFEATSHWLRAKELSADTIRELASRLTAQLASGDDPAGFRRPFAALVLSEVVRADRIDPVLDPETRRAIVDLAADYLRGVRDYRGYDEAEGWRHGVAHGADLALQLGVHPLVQPAEVARLLESVASQVAPPGEVFYVYGEPERLARVVYFVHRRGVLDTAWWRDWFAAIADPAPLDSWGAAFGSQAGLAKRHDTVAFLLAVGFAARSGGDEVDSELKEMAEEALVAVLGG